MEAAPEVEAAERELTEEEQTAVSKCKDVAAGREFDKGDVIEAMRFLERKKPAVDLEALKQGEWRLCYTTGEKRRENQGLYQAEGLQIPTEVVYTRQMFEPDGRIENGVYLTENFALRFIGQWSFEKRRLKFTFDKFEPRLFGADFSFLTGPQDGLFNCIYADRQIFVARGQGGGLAIWTNKRAPSQS